MGSVLPQRVGPSSVDLDETFAELRAIRASIRTLHFARMDIEAEVADLFARLKRVHARLTSLVDPPLPLFSDGGGI